MAKRLLIFLIIITAALSPQAFAYTVGPREYSIDLAAYAEISNGEYNGSYLYLRKNSQAVYDIYVPFNSIGADIEYETESESVVTVGIDDTAYNVNVSKGGGTANAVYDITKRIGEYTLTISSTSDIKIKSVVFNKEDADVPTGRTPLLPKLTDEEEAVATSVIVSCKSNIVKVNGARRYIDNGDENKTPVIIDGRALMPIAALARSLGYYYEDLPDKGYILLRKNDKEYTLKDGKLYKRTGQEDMKPIGNNIVYIDGEAYASLRFFAEEDGKYVGYKDGIIVIDNRHSVNNVLNSELFNEIKKEFDSYIPNKKGGNVYHVAQSGTADDNNSGTAEAPFATLAKACEIAAAGDTVIVHEGIYREILAPKNNGTAVNPIKFMAAEGEKVVLSANEKVGGFVPYENGIYVASMGWDLGKGRNQLFYNSEAVAEARHPNTHTSNRNVLDNLRLGTLWPTQGNIKIPADNIETAVSDTDLDNEPDFWKGGVFVSLHGSGWALGTADIKGSDKGILYLQNTTKQWWFDNIFETDFGYITCCKNAIDVENEWTVENNLLYYYPPAGTDPEKLEVEMKKRQIVADLENSKYVQLIGFEGIGGGIKMNNSEMCMLDNCKLEYLSHYTSSQDNRDGYIDDRNQYNPNGAPQRGEMGVYIGGRDNIVVNSDFNYSAAAGIYLVGKYAYIENNIISNCGYMGSYVGGLFMDSEAWKDVDTPRGGHGIFANTMYNAGRSVFAVGVNEDWLANGVVPPMMPDEVAYNEFYNSAICTRDVGITYVHGVVQGTDKLKTKMHNNMCYDAWAYDEGHAINFGIYYDNSTQMIEVYDNLVFYSSKYAKTEQGIYIQKKQLFPNSFSYTDVWNNSILNLREGGRESITAADYPDGKPFRTGAVRESEEYLENYNRAGMDYCEYTAKDTEISNGVTIEDGLAAFSGNDEWICFKNVDFGTDKNMIDIYYTGDIFNTGDQVEVIVGKDMESGYRFTPKPFKVTSPYLNGRNLSQLIVRHIEGINNVYIKTKDFRSAKIDRIELETADIDKDLLAQVYGSDVTDFVAGNEKQIPTIRTVSGDAMNGCINNTWEGTVLHFSNVEILDDANTFVYSAATQSPYSGNTVELRIGAPDGEIIAEGKIEGEAWSEYVQREVSLNKEIPAGRYDIYLTFRGEKYSCNFYWFGFKNKSSE